ncbi:MAG: hypothetical protein J6J31_01440 [Thermoguttaceae bacterium]|nr:hypothetical protein [Thermoguttaceae bacterium]
MKKMTQSLLLSFFASVCVLFGGSVLLLAEVPNSLKTPLLPENLRVLTGTENQGRAVKRNNMVFQWLHPQIVEAEKNWRTAYESVKTPEQVAEYQKRLRAEFISAIGGFPERTPLNPKIMSTMQRNGITMEKLVFESRPNHYVSAILYLPDETKYPKPWSGVVVACGHNVKGKGLDIYQKTAALHALNGIAALHVDPIDQGERFQNFDLKTKKERVFSVQGHNQLGVGAILMGQNTARFEIWDIMRALDYLQTRDDIRHDSLGMAGLSGGGTQTSYVMALDDRVKAACSLCYTCSLYGLMKVNDTQDAEQNIFGQAAFGMDHADYCIMRAPRPTFLGTATGDFFPIEMGWQSFRDAKRMFQRLGYGENIDLAETDNHHTYDKTLREATVRFMLRFLEKRETPIFEPESLQALPYEEILVTPEGQTVLLPGARTTYDLNRDEAKRLTAERKPIDAETVAKIRELAKVRDASAFGEMKVRELGEEKLGDGISAKKLILEPEAGIYLPTLLFKAENTPEKADVVLFVSDKGKTARYDESILPLVKSGKLVLSIDLRGWGETQQSFRASYYRPSHLGTDGADFYAAYNLGKTHVGFRTDDILAVTRWLKTQPFCVSVELYGLSEGCIPVLHAAVLEKDTFQHVTLERCLISWTNTVENGEHSRTPLTSTVHGALRVYDLPEMRDFLGEKLTLKSTKEALEAN